MPPLQVESTAKINWFLHVLGKRPDGYHGVRTLMLPITLGDTLTLEPLPDAHLEITCSDPALPTDDRNLVRRAAVLLQSRHAPARGARIHLEKRVPIGAGLGGGSSNGSTTLVALNRLWNLGLPDATLEKLSAEFGSDTAFFIRNKPALSEGRGEILTPVQLPVTLPILLMNFGFGSATGWAYKHFTPLPSPHEKRADDILREIRDALAKGRFVPAQSTFENDLEVPVFAKFPILRAAKEFLAKQPGVAASMMCGSGSTMMAVLQSPEAGPAVQKSVRDTFGPSVWTWTGSTQPS